MDVARFSKPRQILSDDDVTTFSCGNEDVDAWLRARAKRARAQGIALTYITFDEDGSIAGLYALSAVFVARNEVVGGWLRRNALRLPDIHVHRDACRSLLVEHPECCGGGPASHRPAVPVAARQSW